MKTAHVSTEIARPIEDVFDFMLDPVEAPRWRHLLTRMEPVDAQPMRAGSRVRIYFELAGAQHVQEITLAECERPHRQTWVNTANGFDFRVQFTLVSVGAHTRVTIEANTRGTRLSTWPLVPFVTRSHRERFAGVLARLKRVMEAQ